MNIIITAYHNDLIEYKDNHSSIEVLKLIPDTYKGFEIRKVLLPILFDGNFDVLKKYIDLETKIIISLGTVPTNRFALERLAINIKHANGKDNSGYSPTDEIIQIDGLNAYFSTLPLRRIESKLNELNIPVGISNSAGTGICNNIMYHTAYYAQKSDYNYVFGFIHIPHMVHNENKKYSYLMDIDIIKEGLLKVIDEVIGRHNI